MREQSLENGDAPRSPVIPADSGADQSEPVTAGTNRTPEEESSGSEPGSPDPPSKAIKIEEGPLKDIVEMTSL